MLKQSLEKELDKYKEEIELNPDNPLPYFHIGNILLEERNLEDAIFIYKMSLEKDPKNAGVYNNIGTAYAMEQKYFNAINYFKKAVKHDPEFKDALINLASAFTSSAQTEKAIKIYEKAIKKYPENITVAENLYHLKRQNADWKNLPKIKNWNEPFINVIYDENLKSNLDVAKKFSKSFELQNKKYKFNKKKKGKLNIGYVSAHFHNHPTGHLISSLFEYHDKSKFNIYIYCLGPNDFSSYYGKIKKSATKFRDLYNVNFSESADQIYKDKIDILIDLDGYTDNNRLLLFAKKIAPIQITYLGFPGTLGTKFVNYILTDKVVTPKSYQKYFTEKFIYLPNSYQVNDDSLEISEINYKRKDFKLPLNKFIFASFNGTYKIEPEVFGIWMNILKKVPESILWLYKNNKVAEKNLKNEAKKRGIDPKRLIFAKRLSREKHLKRLSLADLSLDTFICNGHTTTSDSLWANVPVVTKIGKHFASRVAASILTAAGFPELITKTPKEYEELIIKIAKDPELLKSLKDKLEENKTTKSYFDTQKFTRNLEEVYINLWQKGF
ncbi:hypothetical protein BH10PAT1_BH10PAT1_1010 [soil metagenome]